MIARYRVVRDCDLDVMAQRVDDAMGEGWEPLGAPFAVPSFALRVEVLFCQAMVRSRLSDNDRDAIARRMPR